MMRTLIVLFAAFITLLPASSWAFVQTQTCSPTGGLGQFRCHSGETPKPVQWDTRCIGYYVNERGSTDLDEGTISTQTTETIQASFGSWTAVPNSDVIVLLAGLTDEDRAEFANDREENANVLVWRDSSWPYASKTAFAITSVTFNPNTGFISDADIEFNGEHHQFTHGNENVVVDLQNTLTHEAGHFLGLDHSPDRESTMFGSAPNGEVAKRTLHPDDISGIASIYPALNDAVECDELPNYFKKPGKEGCCATSKPTRPLPWIIVVVLLIGTRRIRRGTAQA